MTSSTAEHDGLHLHRIAIRTVQQLKSTLCSQLLVSRVLQSLHQLHHDMQRPVCIWPAGASMPLITLRQAGNWQQQLAGTVVLCVTSAGYVLQQVTAQCSATSVREPLSHRFRHGVAGLVVVYGCCTPSPAACNHTTVTAANCSRQVSGSRSSCHTLNSLTRLGCIVPRCNTRSSCW